MFTRFKSLGLKLEPGKFVLFQLSVSKQTTFFGERGIDADPANVESVCDWPVPKNATDVKSFLGFASYYRRFFLILFK